jgi:hypothetical protein
VKIVKNLAKIDRQISPKSEKLGVFFKIAINELLRKDFHAEENIFANDSPITFQPLGPLQEIEVCDVL